MDEKPRGKQSAPGEAWVTVRVPREIKDWLDHWAARRERSLSYLIRKLIVRAYINDEQFKPDNGGDRADDEREVRP